MKNIGNLVLRFTPFVRSGSVVGSNNFLPVPGCLRMGHRSFLHSIGLGLIVLFVMAGCKTMQPVSSTIKETHKKDSVTAVSKVEKDSVSYVEKVIEKTLPAASTESVYTRAQLDSLIAGLRQMPAGHRTIIQTDPKMQAMLSIAMDSLGRLHLLCTSNGRTYFERDVEKTHLIKSLTAQLTKVNEQNSLMSERIKEYKKSWWEKLEDSLRNWILRILLIVIAAGFILMLIRFGWSKIKSLAKRLI